MKERRKIFLSYAHEDIEMAKKIYNDLKSFGLDIWFDNVFLLGGQNWKIEIKKAIKSSKYFIALLSENSVDRVGYVQKELKIALDILDLYPESGVFIIPIRLEECEPSHEKLYDLHWIDLFPPSEYETGIKNILKVINPNSFLLRSKPLKLSKPAIVKLIREHGFYDSDINPFGQGFSNKYQKQNIEGSEIVLDYGTGLIWQHSGSAEELVYKMAIEYIEGLNRSKYAGFNDWRLPTIEEAMSLLESEKKNGDLYILHSAG